MRMFHSETYVSRQVVVTLRFIVVLFVQLCSCSTWYAMSQDSSSQRNSEFYLLSFTVCPVVGFIECDDIVLLLPTSTMDSSMSIYASHSLHEELLAYLANGIAFQVAIGNKVLVDVIDSSGVQTKTYSNVLRSVDMLRENPTNEFDFKNSFARYFVRVWRVNVEYIEVDRRSVYIDSFYKSKVVQLKHIHSFQKLNQYNSERILEFFLLTLERSDAYFRRKSEP